MKKIALAVLMLLPMKVKANPYYRLALLHPTPVAGALLAAEDLKQSELAGLYPVLSHSPKDGCLLPSIVCEDWSPLAVGGSVNGGQWSLVIGPVFNVLPWMQNLVLQVVPDRYAGLRAILAPATGDSPVTFSAGPMWEYKQSTNKGYYRTFTGAALHF